MDLSQEEWAKRIAEDSDAVILDVRTEIELEDGFIPKSKNLDFQGGSDFIDTLKTLDKAKNYYVYCRSGNRSSDACKVMRQLGFENLYNLEGGFRDWEGDVEEIY